MSRDAKQSDVITGIHALQGHGVNESRGFWEEAWNQVRKGRAAQLSIVWLSIVAFFAVFAPIIASGHPFIYRTTNSEGVEVVTSPLLNNLSSADWLLLIGTIVGGAWVLLPARNGRWPRVGAMIFAGVQGALITIGSMLVAAFLGRRDAPDWVRDLEQNGVLGLDVEVLAAAALALVVGLLFLVLPAIAPFRKRVLVVGLTSLVAGVIAWGTWSPKPETFSYRAEILLGEAEGLFTIVPWSPGQVMLDRGNQLLPPGTTSETPLAKTLGSGIFKYERPLTDAEIQAITDGIEDLPLRPDERDAVRDAWSTLLQSEKVVTRSALEEDVGAALTQFGHPFFLGTDSKGQDVMSQMLHACRLAISIGLVSTGIAVMIGVTIGSLMGYFGGFIDLMLYRVVEVFMAVPVLFLLIIAAGVLPAELRSTYVMMAIIGCFTWHRAARFTRAEFLKLRNQDFVQSARSVGLPLRSILFRHMLPNGVTPVLVDASFLIASAILFETILSYLGLGPPDQASWGRLLSDATGDAGDFKWWLAIFPGLVIFLTVLSYNLIGEAFQMAIDPKLKKARV